MDYQKLMDMRNAQNPFMQYTGIRITKIEQGHAEAELTVCDKHVNPLGTVHGGCLYTLADSVSGAAAVSFGRHAVTISGTMNYLSPATGTVKLRAVAQACKHGRSILVFDVCVLGDEGAVFAKGIFTFYVLDKEIAL